MNRLDEPVFMALPKPMLSEFDIHHRLVSCGLYNTMVLMGKISRYLNRNRLAMNAIFLRLVLPLKSGDRNG